ncbi:hypothetical protein TVD_11965 [Thioalkalivibrio versutus]|uniref:Uncharacterized protein n=1 Tax=Thioalkalivibrio versutus TaxID=106634 RepID=A0A0G3G6L7_9GAMM|nr:MULTISPECIES: hypothetical protein [Thioalkalivibrio]AKJ96024.1 hypothetical protein TVD_11965 [Thioalkalivibrio versutus]
MSSEFEVESLRPLVAAAEAGGTLNAEVDQALAALEQELNRLAGELQVEYVGPAVGMADMQAEHVYRLVIRQHEIDVTRHEWSLWVCDALDNCDFRATWPVTGAARLRRKQVVAVVPELVAGYRDAVAAAGKADTPAGQRLAQIASVFS